MNTTYEEGRAAALAGKPRTDNPYSDTSAPVWHVQWDSGWASVEQKSNMGESVFPQTDKPLLSGLLAKHATAPLAVIDIPAGYPNEAAFLAFLRAKGYDANVCDSARVLWNGAVVRWSVPLSAQFDALEAEFLKQTFTDPVAAELACEEARAIIKLDGKPWGWTRGSGLRRLEQKGVPEHIALTAITLAVLGGKAIVFGADGAQITVERG